MLSFSLCDLIEKTFNLTHCCYSPAMTNASMKQKNMKNLVVFSISMFIKEFSNTVNAQCYRLVYVI